MFITTIWLRLVIAFRFQFWSYCGTCCQDNPLVEYVFSFLASFALHLLQQVWTQMWQSAQGIRWQTVNTFLPEKHLHQYYVTNHQHKKRLKTHICFLPLYKIEGKIFLALVLPCYTDKQYDFALLLGSSQVIHRWFTEMFVLV